MPCLHYFTYLSENLSIRTIPGCFDCVTRFSSQLACLTNRALDRFNNTNLKYDNTQIVLSTVSGTQANTSFQMNPQKLSMESPFVDEPW